MPTKADFEELIRDTTNAWVTDYNGITGLNGRLFTAENGNTLFIPAAGNYDGSKRIGAGENGRVWSASLYSVVPNFAFNLDFGSYIVVVDGGYVRFSGLPVRGVQNSPAN